MSSIPVLCRFRPPEKLGRMIVWEITNRCNLDCLHCCTESSSLAPSRDVPTEMIMASLSNLAECDVAEVYFSGGEPLARMDIVEFSNICVANGANVFIASNGTLITERLAHELKDAGVREMTISLDGATPETYVKLRRRPEMYDKVLKGISACVNIGLPVRISATIHPWNIGDVSILAKMADNWNVAIIFGAVIPAGRATKHPALQMSPSQLQELEKQIAMLRSQYPHLDLDYNLGMSAGHACATCPAFSRVLHITCEGYVSPCSWLYKNWPAHFVMGDITHEPLLHIIQNPQPYIAELPTMRHCPAFAEEKGS